MVERIRGRLTYANVTATVALFLALSGGVAWALASNSVKSRHIANGHVKTPDLASDSVKGKHVVDDSLKAEDFAPGELPQPAPLTSFESLNGLACELQGETGAIEVSYAGNGDATLSCELPVVPECSSEEDPPTLPNAVAACVDGRIVLTSCNPGFHNINEQIADGCEYAADFTGDEVCDGEDNDADGQIDEGVVPPSDAPNATFVCNGSWEMICHLGWEDANTDQSDGCEAARQEP